jgi:hypothetical protein
MGWKGGLSRLRFFKNLARALHRMLGPRGNPNTVNFFAILQVLQKRVGVKLTVKAA